LATPLTVPPVTLVAQGKVWPLMVTVQPPVLEVVALSGLPVAQLTAIVPPTIGRPTAAVPLRVVATGALLLPPPQADSSALPSSIAEPMKRPK
jgi:hypothetical protein